MIADHGQPGEGSDGAGIPLEIVRQAAIAADPGQGAFDDPALGQDDEFVQFVALDDLEHPTTRAGSRSRDARSLIAGIGEDALDEGEEAKRQPAGRSRTRRAPSRSLTSTDERQRSAGGRGYRPGYGACAR